MSGWQNDLEDFLLRHEDDIAYGINDFDDLRTVFIAVTGKQPIEENSTVQKCIKPDGISVEDLPLGGPPCTYPSFFPSG